MQSSVKAGRQRSSKLFSDIEELNTSTILYSKAISLLYSSIHKCWDDSWRSLLSWETCVGWSCGNAFTCSLFFHCAELCIAVCVLFTCTKKAKLILRTKKVSNRFFAWEIIDFTDFKMKQKSSKNNFFCECSFLWEITGVSSNKDVKAGWFIIPTKVNV